MLQKRKFLLQSDRLVQKKKRKRIIILVLFILFIIALCVGFYIFLRLPFLNIRNINVTGTEALDKDAIKAKAEESLSGTSYLIIPKSNLFLYKKGELQKKLEDEYPRIKDVTLDVRGNSLNINIVEKKAFALWCSDTCYFMDESGNIFSSAPDFNGTVYKKFYGGIDGDPVGKNLLSKDALSKIKTIYDEFDSYKVVISRIDVVSPKEVKLTSIYGVEFLINLEKDSTETVDNIQTILTADRFKDSLPRLKGIQYIDFRFGSKVFFKKN